MKRAIPEFMERKGGRGAKVTPAKRLTPESLSSGPRARDFVLAQDAERGWSILRGADLGLRVADSLGRIFVLREWLRDVRLPDSPGERLSDDQESRAKKREAEATRRRARTSGTSSGVQSKHDAHLRHGLPHANISHGLSEPMLLDTVGAVAEDPLLRVARAYEDAILSIDNPDVLRLVDHLRVGLTQARDRVAKSPEAALVDAMSPETLGALTKPRPMMALFALRSCAALSKARRQSPRSNRMFADEPTEDELTATEIYLGVEDPIDAVDTTLVDRRVEGWRKVLERTTALDAISSEIAEALKAP